MVQSLNRDLQKLYNSNHDAYDRQIQSLSLRPTLQQSPRSYTPKTGKRKTTRSAPAMEEAKVKVALKAAAHNEHFSFGAHVQMQVLKTHKAGHSVKTQDLQALNSVYMQALHEAKEFETDTDTDTNTDSGIPTGRRSSSTSSAPVHGRSRSQNRLHPGLPGLEQLGSLSSSTQAHAHRGYSTRPARRLSKSAPTRRRSRTRPGTPHTAASVSQTPLARATKGVLRAHEKTTRHMVSLPSIGKKSGRN